MENQNIKRYHVSKSGGTTGITSAIMFSGIKIKKFNPVSSGVVSMQLTSDEVEKLRNHGCVVTEADEDEEQHGILELFATSSPTQII